MEAAVEPVRRGRGRPAELTVELQDKIVRAILVNGYVETASAFAGISKDTFYRWLKRGAKANGGKYKEFSDAVGRAMAEAEMCMSMVVHKAANGWDVEKKRTVTEPGRDGKPKLVTTTESYREFDPRAAEWWLERARPQRWGRREYHEGLGELDRPTLQIQQQINIFDPAKMAELLAAWVEADILPKEMVLMLEASGSENGANGQSPD